MLSVLLYTTPTCPDCHTLKAWLERGGVSFREKDLTDSGVAAEAKAQYGIRVAPLTVVGEKVFYGAFADQRPRFQQVLDTGEAA